MALNTKNPNKIVDHDITESGVKHQIKYLIIQHPLSRYERPNTMMQFQLFYKYKYMQQCTMTFILKKINLKENQRGILTFVGLFQFLGKDVDI